MKREEWRKTELECEQCKKEAEGSKKVQQKE